MSWRGSSYVVLLALLVVAALYQSARDGVGEGKALAPAVVPPVLLASAVIRSVGHDERSWTLEVEFADRTIYRYADVPAGEYRALKVAVSKARHFQERVRGR